MPFFQFERRMRAFGVGATLGPAVTGPKGETRRMYELELDGKVVGTRFSRGNDELSFRDIDALCAALGIDPLSIQ